MLPKFKKITLKNELEVYHIPVNLGSGVISVDLIYKVGSRNEIMGKSGIAHMLEHMNFKSTKNRKAGEFDKIIKGFGGIDNASTGFDYTHYFIKCSNSNLEKSLDLLSDMMANLSLKDDEFQPERQVVAEERRWRTDNNPFGYLFFSLFNLAFDYHPYHWTPIGFMDDIQNWSIDDIKNFHQIYYQPKNAFLMITGDCDEKTALNLATKYFGNIKNKANLPKFYFKEVEQKGEKSAVIYKESEVEMCALAYKIPPFNHKDMTAISALGDYLSDGESSLLRKNLIDKLNLVNQIDAYALDLKDESLFIIIAVCNPGVEAIKVKAKILKIIQDCKTKPVPKDELTKLKNSIKSDFVYSLASASNIAQLYAGYIARGDLKPLLDLEKNTAKLSGSNLQSVAKKYLVDEKLTTIILKGKQ